MHVLRTLAALAAAALTLAAVPASAQFYFKSHDLSGPPVTGAEPGIVGQALPGATPAELRAALVWNLRAALNVAALQCQFEPTLLTVPNYNKLIRDHGTELDTSYATLTGYFMRTAPNKKAGQSALDQFGTRVYSGFSTIQAQYSFCQTANAIGNEALFAPRGHLGELAEQRMRQLRNSLIRWGEQQFTYSPYLPFRTPQFGNKKCWKRDQYRCAL
jgi:hypothetical protein